MTAPFTIAHIADLHLSTEHKRGNIRKVRALLDFIVRSRVDHLVISGDIAANAEPRELEMARRLLKSFGLLRSQSTSVVIGNHDIFGGVHAAEDILSFPRRCRTTRFGDRVKAFRDMFHELFDSCLVPDESKVFPYAKPLGDVVLFGVNSVAEYSALNNPVGSNGKVGKNQFGRLLELLGSPLLKKKRKIVMIHHHFHKTHDEFSGAMGNVWNAIERQTMKLRGKKKLVEAFRAHGIEMVLHGHVHRSMAYERDGVRFMNGGGSVHESAEGAVSVNLIQVSAEGVTAKIHRVEPDRIAPARGRGRLEAAA